MRIKHGRRRGGARGGAERGAAALGVARKAAGMERPEGTYSRRGR
jgi:hypothetical protein